MNRPSPRLFIPAALCLTCCGPFTLARAHGQAQPQSERGQPSQQEDSLVITNDPSLPEGSLQTAYEVRLQARGGVAPLIWRLDKGALPPGIKLEENGLLHGTPERSGEFQFTASVRDSSHPSQAVERLLVIVVRSALVLNWKSPAHVNGNRIEGSVEVSNTTPDDIDLTFIVLAVPSDGRATAIGYQHFSLHPGATSRELPFGEMLPRGGYVVHVDAVGEVAPKNLIYRERLQTPSPLQVAIGP